jgi:hypothetical protein
VIDPADLATLLVADPDTVPQERIADLIAEHERRKALLLVRLTRSAAEPPAGRDRVLPVTEVAMQLGLSPREVRRLFTRPAGLPHVPLGVKTKGVLESDLVAFIASRRQEPPEGRSQHRRRNCR